jgi:hypothetical protein
MLFLELSDYALTELSSTVDLQVVMQRVHDAGIDDNLRDQAEGPGLPPLVASEWPLELCYILIKPVDATVPFCSTLILFQYFCHHYHNMGRWILQKWHLIRFALN